MTFFGALWAAGGADIMATQFHVTFEGVIMALRWVALIGPIIAYALTRRICRALQAQDRDRLRHGTESGVIVRSPGGGYSEAHRTLSSRQKWALSQPPSYRVVLGAEANRATASQRLRSRLQRSFDEDRSNMSQSAEVEQRRSEDVKEPVPVGRPGND